MTFSRVTCVPPTFTTMPGTGTLICGPAREKFRGKKLWNCCAGRRTLLHWSWKLKETKRSTCPIPWARPFAGWKKAEHFHRRLPLKAWPDVLFTWAIENQKLEIHVISYRHDRRHWKIRRPHGYHPRLALQPAGKREASVPHFPRRQRTDSGRGAQERRCPGSLRCAQGTDPGVERHCRGQGAC